MRLVLGIFPNLEKSSVLNILEHVVNFCHTNGIVAVLPDSIANEYGCKGYSIEQQSSMNCLTAAMSLGGDGTLLRMTRYTASLKIPVFGVNLGKLGFLTEVELPQMEMAILKVRDGEYSVENRSMLQAVVFNSDKAEVLRAHALNDFVLTKGHFSRLARLDVKIAGQKSIAYPSDGVIVATATGSTAYSLAAGGPIVYPGLDVSILTPICAHSLETRPLIIPMSDAIEIKVMPPCGEWYLATDGINIKRITENEKVVIQKSPLSVKFLRIYPSTYYETWQEKLRRD
ncbi:MAG: NAD(+)/NADH kinase [Negativicutes bacterium]|nr:NAD(+)/NADH kinase [Negativicutes bacterium]